MVFTLLYSIVKTDLQTYSFVNIEITLNGDSSQKPIVKIFKDNFLPEIFN